MKKMMNYSHLLTSANLRHFKIERREVSRRSAPCVVFSLLGLIYILLFFIYYSSYVSTEQELDQEQTTTLLIQPNQDDDCDFFTGHWIPDLNRSRHTNWNCSTIPDSKNCVKNGRKDVDFVNWRWKSDGCELPRFNPKTFLRAVEGKNMAFVGDSLARNQAESLLCLLSKEETATDIYKDIEDRFRTWFFPSHSFTLMVLWSKFLIAGEERLINSTSSSVYSLHLDKIDNKWAEKLPGVDFAVISGGQCFFPKMYSYIYLYEGGNLIGCLYCNDTHVADLGLGFALRKAFRIALEHITSCNECSRVTLLRTFSPAHFENGGWNTRGNCRRTGPLRSGVVRLEGSTAWELRGIQVEEVERARKEGMKRGKRFGALDITRAMFMRPDGHPGSRWNNYGKKGYNDCIHWCIPGPIDAWNDLLMAMLRT